MSLADGQVLDGKYVITRRIADGGMATVYLGTNTRIGKDVAVKVLHPGVAREEEVVARFEREARIVSRIRSPHVADVYDFGALETGEHFMVMEYLEGESLASMLERERTIPTRQLAHIASQILQGLSAAHAASVVHRDLKPENLIVTQRGRERIVKIVDFGISKVVVRADGTSIFPEARATSMGAVLGTPLYMSPEQARGNTDVVDQRTDLYSLGVILYEAIAGEPPLTGENVNDLLFKVALDEPTPLVERVPNVDRGFAAIVAKAMAKQVSDRYQTADDMFDAIEAWRAQFASGSQAAIPLNEQTAVRATEATPMALVSAPSRREEPTKTRRYAFALVPALAAVLLLLPFAGRLVSQPMSPAPMTVQAAEPNTVEPVLPSTKIIPIAAEVPVQSAQPKPVAAPVVRWSPPSTRLHRAMLAAVVADAGAGSGSDAIAMPEPVAAAPEETPTVSEEPPPAPMPTQE